ncbi:MAG: aldo/keto reductase, partial [Desulfovibrio sp.]|nr:aldo/keto reductase [Desulfovibrio sp.]
MASQDDKGRGVSRREFFKGGLALGLGAAAGAVVSGAGEALAQTGQPAGPVARRLFGRAGDPVSILSLGGMFDILNNRLLLAKALDWGVNYWDTAEGYGGGRSEEGIGRWLAKNPGTRKEIFLASKLKFKWGEEPTARLEESLKRLSTDHLDVLFMHAVSGTRELEQHLPAWAEAQKKAGKIRLFGFTTHGNMEECLEAAAKRPWVDAVMFTYNYRLMAEPRMNAAVEACYRAGIGLTAMKTMGGGQVKSDSDLELKL